MSDSKKFNWTGWLIFAAILLFWEYGSRSNPRLQLYFPPVSQVVIALAQTFVSGEIVNHLLTTLARFMAGYFIAALVVVIAGIILGYFRVIHSLLDILIELLRLMPSVAIIPVAILLLGIGNSMIVAVTVYATMWPILINTVDGVRHIDRTLVATGRTFGLSR